MTHAHTAGTTNLVVTVAVALYFGFATRQLNLGWIYDSYVPLMSAAIALSFALSAGASHGVKASQSTIAPNLPGV